MPEIKHTFQGGKMNKDLDERLVPSGEYRDAMNIQVRTTEGDAAGTVQNLQGNKDVGTSHYLFSNASQNWFIFPNMDGDIQYPYCVASVSDEKSDKAYFFFAAPPLSTNDIMQGAAAVYAERIFADTIIEQDSAGTTTPVFNDIWTIVQTANVVLPNTTGTFTIVDADGEVIPNSYSLANIVTEADMVSQVDVGNSTGQVVTQLQVVDSTNYRVGMTIEAYGPVQITDENEDETWEQSNDLFTNGNPKIKYIDNDTNTILFHEAHPVESFYNASHFVFRHDKVLNFKWKESWITGINVIDDLLFWTDGTTEPKRINITNCKAGTLPTVVSGQNLYNTQTNIFVQDPLSLDQSVNVNTVDNNLGSDPINSNAQEKNITVIKRAPRTAPTLEMKSTLRDNASDIIVSHLFIDNDLGAGLQFGSIEKIESDSLMTSNFRKDDIIVFTQVGEYGDAVGQPVIIKAKFVSYLSSDNEEEILTPTSIIKITVLSVSGNSYNLTSINDWKIDLQLKRPLFERKMVRFGYRYKYEDGEYSSFSPWSEIAFLPGAFDYNSKDAHNLGMFNTVRQLIIKDFIPYKRPIQVKEIDILYKKTDSANVYVAATVTRGKSNEWELFTPDGIETISGGDGEIKTGKLTITSEMIHKALPSTQVLRGWDNVPRYALAQEITGNRLVYGNYTQGYNINTDINLLQEVTSTTTTTYPQKSIKSIRDYKVGMVFGDKYGRETPVINSGYSIDSTGEDESISGDISIEKSLCAMVNRFKLTMDWDNPPNWLKDGGYVKYYIKETSNEYYNLIMDRWYNSGDGTIWLSFNSADRNKVDEETYLLLKSRNGTDEPVLEDARYKVISIRNEAPDYIKTEYYHLGELVITPYVSDDVGGDGIENLWEGDDVEQSEPTGFWGANTNNPGGRSIVIPEWMWNNGTQGSLEVPFNSEHVFGREIKGQIDMQVIGRIITGGVATETHFSGWRRISHYNRTSQGVGGVSISWKENFSNNATNGANMYQAFGGGTVTGLQYSIRFREAVIENLPEFDGKFFVKVAKDETLVNQVVAGSFNYEEVATYNISYIESATNNQTQWNGGVMAASDKAKQANFNTSAEVEGQTAQQWFYGAFAGLWNNIGEANTTLSNDNFGLARWNEDNGGGTHISKWGVGDGTEGIVYSPDTSYNGGEWTFENTIGASMGVFPGAAEGFGPWYLPSDPSDIIDLITSQQQALSDGEITQAEYDEWEAGLNGSLFQTPGNQFNWNTVDGAINMNSLGGSTTAIGGFSPGYPFPRAWNFNYYANGEDAYNRQHPTWWGNNEVQSMNADVDGGDGMIQGPSIMGQLCGPMSDDWDVVAAGTENAFPWGWSMVFSNGQFILGSEQTNWVDYTLNQYGVGLASINNFGAQNGVVEYNKATHDFWESYRDNNGSMFIDAAGARRAFGGPIAQFGRNYASIPDEAWQGLPSKNQAAMNILAGDGSVSAEDAINAGYVDFYKHKGLDEGIYPNADGVTYGAQGGTIGRMFLGYLLGNENGLVGEINSLLNEGTYFSFPNAPLDSDGSQQIFRIIYVDQTYITHNYSGYPYPLTNSWTGQATNEASQRNHLGWKCTPCGWDDTGAFDGGSSNGWYDPYNGCIRKTTAIEFRKVNRTTNQVSNEGLDVLNFDPRSWMHHDGRDSIYISIMQPAEELDVDGYSINNHLNACWETEPRESADLDLYYEASDAIPMVLNNENSFDYIPANSKIKVFREGEGGVDIVSLSGGNNKINNIHFLNNDSVVNIIKKSGEQWTLQKDSIKINDILSFEHKDGTITSTKVTGFMEPIFGEDTVNGELNSSESLIGVVDNPRSFQDVSNVEADLLWSTNIDGTYDVYNPSILVSDSIPIEDLQGASVSSVYQIIPESVFGNEIVNNFESTNFYISSVVPLSSIQQLLPDVDLTAYAGYNVAYIASTDGTPVFSPLDNMNPETIAFSGDGIEGLPTFIYQPTMSYSIQLPFTITYRKSTGYYRLDSEVWKYPVELGWFNCYTFGNGVESDRIGDDFNAPQIDNGVRVSTTFSGYGKENKSSGMIYSGLYNSISEVNDLNEFNMSEKITKDLNPSYGSIQALKTRDTDLIALAEDKILRILANKDAVFNADGNPNLTATNRVLGTAMPFVGDYGISKNPESLAWDQFRLYFTDTQRGAVLRLSRDGLTPISDIGMRTWFRDNIAKQRPQKILGTFDTVNGEYNVTMSYGDNSNLSDQTVSFNETAKGWVSFKSFIPSQGTSVSGKYFTVQYDKIYEHYIPTYNDDGTCDYGENCSNRNTFYGIQEDSYVDVIFNKGSGAVKSFRTINYEGSQARITQDTQDNEYYNLTNKTGWWASSIKTDLQEGSEIEFKNKENKWFAYLKGDTTSLSNLDTKEFSVQGLGQFVSIDGTTYILGCMDESALNYNEDANASGECCYISGCTDISSANYNPDACFDDGSCVPFIYSCGTGGLAVELGGQGVMIGMGIYPDINGNNALNFLQSDYYEDPIPCEYPCVASSNGYEFGYASYGANPAANYFGMEYCSEPIGCTDENASNYDPDALFDNGSCEYIFPGCTDSTALNYDANATVDDGSCNYIYGCTDPTMFNYDANATANQVSAEDTSNPCIPIIPGCFIENYVNTQGTNGYSGANTDDPSVCIPYVYGCTDPTMLNYNPDANVDDGSCSMVPPGTGVIKVINFPDDSDAQVTWNELSGATDSDEDGIDDSTQ